MAWEVKKLGDVVIIERGGSPRPIQKYLTTSSEGINWIKISDATASDKYIYETKQKITKEGLVKTRLVNKGDFILSNSMSFGRPYIMKITGAIHDGWLVLRQKDEKLFETEFLYYLLSSPYVFQQFNYLASGSTVRNLNITLVSSVKVPIPPLPIQKKIVEVLDSAFEKIAKAKENSEANLKNAKEVFESYLQSVFENKGEGWEEKNLGNILVKTETINPTNIPDKSFEYIDVSSVNNKTFLIESTSIINSANAPSRARKLVKKGDIIFATVRPTLKRIAIIPNNLNEQICSTGYFVLRSKENIVNKLIFYYLQTYRFMLNMEKLQKGASYPAVTDSQVKEQTLVYPKSLEEQKAIVSKLDNLSEQTKQLESIYSQKLSSLEELKQSILQKAFKGELTEVEA